jgi:hypothetical protein
MIPWPKVEDDSFESLDKVLWRREGVLFLHHDDTSLPGAGSRPSEYKRVIAYGDVTVGGMDAIECAIVNGAPSYRTSNHHHISIAAVTCSRCWSGFSADQMAVYSAAHRMCIGCVTPTVFDRQACLFVCLFGGTGDLLHSLTGAYTGSMCAPW